MPNVGMVGCTFLGAVDGVGVLKMLVVAESLGGKA